MKDRVSHIIWAEQPRTLADCKATADKILTLIRGEVEKMEKRWLPLLEQRGYRLCRQEILDLLDGG